MCHLGITRNISADVGMSDRPALSAVPSLLDVDRLFQRAVQTMLRIQEQLEIAVGAAVVHADGLVPYHDRLTTLASAAGIPAAANVPPRQSLEQ